MCCDRQPGVTSSPGPTEAEDAFQGYRTQTRGPRKEGTGVVGCVCREDPLRRGKDSEGDEGGGTGVGVGGGEQWEGDLFGEVPSLERPGC